MKRTLLLLLLSCLVSMANAQLQTNAGVQYLQNNARDMSTDFSDLSNTYFLADSLSAFDAATASGMVNWKRYRLSPRQAFNLNGYWPVRMQMLDFPDTQYDNDPDLAFQLQFIDDRTVRIRMLTTPIVAPDDTDADPMFCDEFKTMWKTNDSRPSAHGWRVEQDANSIRYVGNNGSIEVQRYPWRVILRDSNGKVLTQTRAIIDNDSTQVKLLPFCFIKRGADNSRSVNPVFFLSPGERIYGCGESFTSLNKGGQKVHLYVTDPQGPETDGMYKPVPFYFSNRGYGIFMHTSAPATCDFGASYIGAQRLFMGDEAVDLFVFFGEPE